MKTPPSVLERIQAARDHLAQYRAGYEREVATWEALIDLHEPRFGQVCASCVVADGYSACRTLNHILDGLAPEVPA